MPRQAATDTPHVSVIVLVYNAWAWRTHPVDYVYFHQIGPDQEGFLRFWEHELRPALAER